MDRITNNDVTTLHKWTESLTWTSQHFTNGQNHQQRRHNISQVDRITDKDVTTVHKWTEITDKDVTTLQKWTESPTRMSQHFRNGQNHGQGCHNTSQVDRITDKDVTINTSKVDRITNKDATTLHKWSLQHLTYSYKSTAYSKPKNFAFSSPSSRNSYSTLQLLKITP